MKFKFKKRNLKELLESWYVDRKAARKQRQITKIEKLESWHESYAWYPMRLTTDDDSIQFTWFEKVHQKYWADRRESTWGFHYVIKKRLEERHTSKDYFLLKLKGEIEREDEFAEMEHDGTNATIHVSNTSPSTKVYVKKADKNDHISMWG